nr:Cullin-associated NEDD8-dissociated protein 1 [Polyrhizophydium stewartii]
MVANDSDFRFMAASDLATELSKDSFAIDDATERKVVAGVLKLIDDKNGEVRNKAVKCLIPLVKKVRDQQIQNIVDELCKMLECEDREGLRDIAGIGLKTLVVEFPSESASAGNVVKRLVPKLLLILGAEGAQSQLDVIDILSEMFSRFGGFLNDSGDSKALQQSILATFGPLIDHSRPAFRKRAIAAVGFLVPNLKDDLFVGLSKSLIADIKAKKSTGDLDKLQSLISYAATLCRHSPARFAPFLSEIMPLVLEYAELDNDDLREQCIQACEVFVLRAPTAVGANIHSIIKLGAEFIKYDPNYDDGGDEDDDEEEMDDADEDEEDEDDESYSDDEDVSWKVRRSSAKLLASIISTRPDLLSEFYDTLAPLLIRRFNEREETVRIDVLNTFITLLRQTATVRGRTEAAGSPTTPASASAAQLAALVPRVVKVLGKQLMGKSIQTRSSGFLLLKQLIAVLNGGLGEHIAALVPAIEHSLAKSQGGHGLANSTNLKIDVLEFVNVLLENHDAALFHAHVGRIVTPVLAAANDKFYRISAEAFGVAASLVRTLRPFAHVQGAKRPSVLPTDQTLVKHIHTIFAATLTRVQATDTSVEVKEKLIGTLGVIVYQAADVIGPQDLGDKVMPIFVDRLRNEVTRLPTIRTLTYVAKSPLGDAPSTALEPFAAQLPVLLPEIAMQLKKTQRQLRIASLHSLETFARRFPTPDLYPPTIEALRHMLTNDSDLQVLPLALSLMIAMLQTAHASSPSAGVALASAIKTSIVPVLTNVIGDTPHLVSGGSSLAHLVEFWHTFAVIGGSDVFASSAQGLLVKVFSRGVTKEAYPVVAKSIAALAISNAPEAKSLLDKFIVDVQGTQGSESTKYLALLTLGEIGNRRDLSQAAPQLHTLLFGLFDSTSEEIKNAAAFALGNVATGNLSLYLPVIVEAVRTDAKHQYLSVLALKEVISLSVLTPESRAALAPFVADIWQLLFDKAETDLEESTRNAIAECLGQLSTADAPTFLPQLQSRLAAHKAETRATVVSAIRYTFAEHASRDQYDLLLAPIIIEFLRLVQDKDLTVRRVTLGALNSAAHSKPHLIRNSLGELLPLLYAETHVNRDLIRIVEMGPFKHEVDTGLDARKSAFECMYTLLDTCLGQIEIFAFIQRVLAGIEDPAHDIKLLSHLMLQRLAIVSPTALAAHLDGTADGLRKTLTSKTKPSAVKQEIEKHRELVHAASKSLVLLAHVAGIAVLSSAAGPGISSPASAAPASTNTAGSSADLATPRFAELVRDMKAPGSPVAEVISNVERELVAAGGLSRLAAAAASASTSAPGGFAGGLVGAAMDLS